MDPIRRPVFFAASVALALFCAAVPAPAQIVLDANGKTIAIPNDLGRSKTIKVTIAAPSIRLCGTNYSPATLSVRYAEQSDVGQPRLLLGGVSPTPMTPSPETPPTVAWSATMTRTLSTSFVVYNVIATIFTPEENGTTINECRTRIAAERKKVDDAETKVDDLAAEAKNLEGALASAREQLKSEQQDVAVFAGMDNAGDQLAAAIVRADARRTAVQNADQALRTKQAELAAATVDFAAAPAAAARNLGAPLARAEALGVALNNGMVLKIGGVAVGGRRKSVHYDFASVSSNSTLHLTPLGAYPVVRFGDEVTVVVANVDRSVHPYPIQVAESFTAGVAINIEPVRPVFDVSAAEAAIATASAGPPVATLAAVDIVMPLRTNFPPNALPEISVVTERPSDADPKKLARVTLVDKAKLPQYRALYRYNFNTGILRSGLRRREFTKVRIADDDPATEDANEARYRTAMLEKDPSILPVAAFTYYIVPVDVQGPVRHERWIPNPTVGFGIADPADNVFLGFAHEVLRNTQVFWGWHWGSQAELVARNAVSEDQDATLAVTRERKERAFSFGLTFNVAVVSKIFK